MEAIVENLHQSAVSLLKNQTILSDALTGIYSVKNVQPVVPYLKFYIDGYTRIPSFASPFMKASLICEAFTLESDGCLSILKNVNNILGSMQPVINTNNIECKLVFYSKFHVVVMNNKIVSGGLDFKVLVRQVS